MTKIGRFFLTLKSYSQFLLLLTGSLLGQVITLFQSSKPIYPCGPVLTFLGKMHLSVMCDVSFYMRDAQDLNRLRYFAMSADQYGTVLQGRPLMPFFGKLLSYLFEVFPFLNHSQTYSGIDKIGIQYSIPIYLSYIFLNALFLTTGLILLLKLFLGADWKRPFSTSKKSLLFLILIIFVFNRLMTFYFWIPNSDILNSIFAAYLAFLAYKFKEIKNSKSFYLHVAAISIGSLFYALFLLVLPIFLIALIISKNYARACVAVLATTPYLIWPFIIKISGGTYVSYESSKFRMFIWVFDGIREGSLLLSAQENFIQLINAFEIPPLFIISLGLALLAKTHNFRSGTNPLKLFKRALRSIFFWAILGYGSWIYLIGLYEPRHSWGFSLFLILIIWKKVFDLYDYKDRALNSGLLVIGALWFSGWAVFTGPYF